MTDWIIPILIGLAFAAWAIWVFWPRPEWEKWLRPKFPEARVKWGSGLVKDEPRKIEKE